jgi:hypothetical protein
MVYAGWALRNGCTQRLAYVLGLLGKRLTLRQRGDLLVQAGWLAMLLGCCHYDLGQREEAEAARQAASRMARQAGHGELLGWAHEMTAWFALVEHCYGDVIEAARTGQQATTGTSAAVQLVLQEAKAHACLGHGAGATRCLDHGAAVLAKLPRPSHPEHHFVFDHTKYLSYSAVVLLRVDQSMAEECARGVIAAEIDASGSVKAPRRIANARLDLATVHAHRGDLDAAVAYGLAAFGDDDRTSVAGLISRGAELAGMLRSRYPQERLASDYYERFAIARRALSGRRALPPPVA